MAGGIIRKNEKGIGIVWDHPEEPERIVRFCPHCLEFGFKENLGPRILRNGEQKPTDFESWLQCIACGNIYGINEAKIESKTEGFVETSDSPFDTGKSITGLGNKRKKTRIQKERQRQLDRIDKVKDEDIKRELKRGNTVEIIEDY